MSEYPSNSFKSREEQKKQEDRKHEAVVTGVVKQKKESWFQKALSLFFAEDIHDLKSYLFYDVFIPAAKRTFLDLVKNGSEMAVNGRAAKISSSSLGASKVSYTNYANPTAPVASTTKSLRVGSYQAPLYAERGDAETVLARMQEAIERYHNVSVGEMFDFAGLPCDYTWNKYGWTDLSSASVTRVDDDGEIYYMLSLPKAMPL